MPKTSTAWSVGNAVTSARLNAVNTDLDDLYAKGSDRMKVYPASGLNVNIGAGSWRVGAASGVYAGGSVAVTASATNYVEIDNTGTVSVNTSGWTSTKARLALVVAGVSSVTSIELHRPDVVGGQLGGAPYGSYSLKTSGTTYQAGPNGGFIQGSRDSGSDVLAVYSDASATPTTLVAWGRNHEAGEAGFVATPILPNMYYKTTGGFSYGPWFYET